MPVRRSSTSPRPRWLNCGLAALFAARLGSRGGRLPALLRSCPPADDRGRAARYGGSGRARRAGRGRDQFRIVAVIKGKDAVGDLIADPVTDIDGAAAAGGDPCLLLHDRLAARWTSLGTIRPEYADWLRQLAATLSVGGERPRLTWPSNMQTSVDAELCRLAAAHRARSALSRKPRSACRPHRLGRARARALRGHGRRKIADRRESSRRLAGRSEARAAPRGLYCSCSVSPVGRTMPRGSSGASKPRWSSHDTTNLAAMIGADLELRGPSRVDWVEATYFADRKRTMPEIEAALLALNVHGDADRTVPRERVIQAYRVFIRERPPMAGFVAPQLADWDYWDAAAEYAALLKSNAIKDPASEFAVIDLSAACRRRQGRADSSSIIRTRRPMAAAAARTTPAEARESARFAIGSHGSSAWTKRRASCARWLREPLLHFLLAGAAIFAVYEAVEPGRQPGGPSQPDRADEGRPPAIGGALACARAPAADAPIEMRALVEQKVSEEILFREALALGLDKNDEIIKRRLAQKMDFLAEDVAALQDPSEAELRAVVRAEFGSLRAAAARELPPPLLLLRSRTRRSRRGRRDARQDRRQAGRRTRSRSGRRPLHVPGLLRRAGPRSDREGVRPGFREGGVPAQARRMAGPDPVGLWLAPRLRRRDRAGPRARLRGGRARRQIRVARSKAARDQTHRLRGDAGALHGRRSARSKPSTGRACGICRRHRDRGGPAMSPRSMRWHWLRSPCSCLLAALIVPHADRARA